MSALLFAVCATGCADECERGRERCDGRTMMSCFRDSCRDLGCVLGGRPARWQSVQLCPVACVKPEEFAFCAESVGPDPSCDPGSHCEGDVVVDCVSGFVVRRGDCARTGLICVDRENAPPTCMERRQSPPVGADEDAGS